MVSWWPGDGDATDIVGANDGSLVDGATFNPAGMVGGAFEFDGDLDRVEIPDDPSLRLQQFTLDAWAYLTSLSFEAVVGKHIDGTIFNSYQIWIDSGGLNATISDGVGAPVHIAGGAVPLKEFFHVALTWDGDQAHLYLNGAVVASADPATFVVGYTATPVFIGADDNGPGFGIDVELEGLVDEVEIFDRALSGPEIAGLPIGISFSPYRFPLRPIDRTKVGEPSFPGPGGVIGG